LLSLSCIILSVLPLIGCSGMSNSSHNDTADQTQAENNASDKGKQKEQPDKESSAPTKKSKYDKQEQKEKHHSNERSSPSNAVSGTMIRVVDGDTVHVYVDGQDENVRLLLVDTPESVHPNKPT